MDPNTVQVFRAVLDRLRSQYAPQISQWKQKHPQAVQAFDQWKAQHPNAGQNWLASHPFQGLHGTGTFQPFASGQAGAYNPQAGYTPNVPPSTGGAPYAPWLTNPNYWQQLQSGVVPTGNAPGTNLNNTAAPVTDGSVAMNVLSRLQRR